MATYLVPNQVKNITLSIQTNNPNIHADLLVAANAMPANIAAELAEREVEWIVQYPDPPSYLLDNASDVLRHLRAGSQTAVAIRLLRLILARRSSTRATQEDRS